MLSIGPVILLVIGRVHWGRPGLLRIVLVVVPLVSIVLSVIVVVLLPGSCCISLFDGRTFGLGPFLGYCLGLRLFTLCRGLLTLPWVLMVATLVILIVLIIVVLILLLLLLLVILTSSGLLTVIVPARLVILSLLLVLVGALLTSILCLLYFVF